MEDIFDTLSDHVRDRLQPGEDFTAGFEGEQSDFVRMNRGRLRQPGHVVQATLNLRLLQGTRHASSSLTLSGHLEEDRERVDAALSRLRAALPFLPEDPHLLVHQSSIETHSMGEDHLSPAGEVVQALVEGSQGLDLVGVYGGGSVFRGFASSWGQRSWYARWSWFLDWSFVHAADKAVKLTLAGERFDPEALQHEIEKGRERLALLGRPSRVVPPGRYRAWLEPAAVQELVELLSWGGFSARARKTHNTPLLRMLTDGIRLHERLSLTEDVIGGVAPDFQEDGFLRPATISLVKNGELGQPLISPRTAREYDLETNGADSPEGPQSLRMEPGDLEEKDILERLGTGVWVSNLWYLNYSDRAAGRVTGMTRFATFWVEEGRIVAPLSVMRFDDTVFALLGSSVEAIGAHAPLSLSTSTYGGRSTSSIAVPGLLLRELPFTL